MESLLIVGNGMVSHRLCSNLVASGATRQYRVTVFGEESRPAYDRVHLTGIFNGRNADSLTLAAADWYRDHGIDLRLDVRVESIDRASGSVQTSKSESIAFDKLVLVTGATPFVPPFPGTHLPRVFQYRTMDDLQRIKATAAQSASAVVIGGGLLGLEGARALLDLGLKVEVLHNADWLMQRQLDKSGGRTLERYVEALGVGIHLSQNVDRIESRNDRLAVYCKGREEALCTDLVLIAAGVRPRVNLAATCGLSHSPSGFVVNDRLETSDPRIYAIGDCALHRGINYGLVVPGYQMADALSARLCGEERIFAGTDLSAKLKLLGADVAALGLYEVEGPAVATHSFAAPGIHRRLVLREGKLVGFVSVGPMENVGAIQDALYPPRELSRSEIKLFETTGSPWQPSKPESVELWPEEATVCNCMRVSRGTLSRCMAEGCNTVESLAARTGASTLCGSCKPLLAELVGAPVPVEKGRRRLLAASLAALIFAIAIAAIPAIPSADSIQLGWTLDRLWRDDFLKQVTGFSLVGLCAGALVFSARKRVRKLRKGDIGLWRFAHALLGVLALMALVAHTGFRMGANLNFILMTNFLMLAVLGAATGGVMALSKRMAPATAQRLQRGWTLAHVVLFWPLPVLILFHALAFYFF